jgi:hypothetical protein
MASDTRTGVIMGSTANVVRRQASHFPVELRGLEPLPQPDKTPIYLQVYYVSFRFSPARYLRFCFRVLTASRARRGGSITRRRNSLPGRAGL